MEETGIRQGQVLAGKYRVVRVLGAGGMGMVVEANHVQLETRVAIKVLLPQMLESPDAVARFEREARAAVRISSEHVARVFDVGTLPNGAPYIVMEFLEGSDLAAWLRSRGPLPIPQAVEFVLQGCVAVAEAHALGIVHRDLKPANLFCVRRADGQFMIKVLDFGISKLTDVGDQAFSATSTTAVMGSPLYMSPEQMAASKNVTAQTDIWALGVILFELLAGAVPFNGDTLPEICVKIATTAPPSLRLARPDVPAAFEGIVSKCLEKDLRRRYRDVADLAQALRAFAPERSRALVDRIAGILHASSRPPENGASTNQAMATSSTGVIVERIVRRRPWMAIAGAVGAAVAFTSLGVFASRSGHRTATADAPTAAATPNDAVTPVPPPATVLLPEAGRAFEVAPADSVLPPVPTAPAAQTAAPRPTASATRHVPPARAPGKAAPGPPPPTAPAAPAKSDDYDHL
jgi:serine/threonine protein kinase